MLDNLWIAHLRPVRAESSVTARPSLAQQIPALVQADLELPHARMLIVIQPDAFLYWLLCTSVRKKPQ
jgi:hypothetical protein